MASSARGTGHNLNLAREREKERQSERERERERGREERKRERERTRERERKRARERERKREREKERERKRERERERERGGRDLDADRQVAVASALVVVVALVKPVFRVSGFGNGYSVAPCGTAYRSALRTSRIRRTTRALLVGVDLVEPALDLISEKSFSCSFLYSQFAYKLVHLSLQQGIVNIGLTG